MTETAGPLLGPAEIRELAARAGIRPTKTLGQNFVLDGGTVRKIVRQADLVPGERVVEVGPGLGSLTLGLLEAGADVVAVEIDPVLARLLPGTVRSHVPGIRVDVVGTDGTVTAAEGAHHAALPDAPPADPAQPVAGLTVLLADALQVRSLPGRPPTALVANLPYNVSVPVLLAFLERFPTLERVLVMVQAEVADRLAAPSGSRTYGIPSAKVAWYASARRTATIGRSVFWPVPNVDSALVRMDRHDPADRPGASVTREQVFEVVDAAFAQRRKMLRSALATLAGSADAASRAIAAAGVDPQARGERLTIADFARVAEELVRAAPEPVPAVAALPVPADAGRGPVPDEPGTVEP
ncbi:ribosomal RNA small subunit methyltransferase A [Cellulomonas hominis]